MLAEKHFPADALDVEEHGYTHPLLCLLGDLAVSQGEERQKRCRAVCFLSVAMNFS